MWQAQSAPVRAKEPWVSDSLRFFNASTLHLPGAAHIALQQAALTISGIRTESEACHGLAVQHLAALAEGAADA